MEKKPNIWHLCGLMSFLLFHYFSPVKASLAKSLNLDIAVVGDLIELFEAWLLRGEPLF